MRTHRSAEPNVLAGAVPDTLRYEIFEGLREVHADTSTETLAEWTDVIASRLENRLFRNLWESPDGGLHLELNRAHLADNHMSRF